MATTFNDLARLQWLRMWMRTSPRKGTEARDALVRQLTLPVRWEESMRALIEQGATVICGSRAGAMLSGLLRQIDRSARTA